jgi:hypothetical protein
MPQSIVDRIPEPDDLRQVPEHWETLVSPLITALESDIQPSDVEHLYVEAGSERIDRVMYFGSDLIADLPGSWPERYLVLTQHEAKPLVLMGDAGVGKTAWLTRFLMHLQNEPTTAAVRYDHNKRLGDLATVHLSACDQLRGYLAAELIAATVRILREYKFKDHPLYNIQPSDYISDPRRFSSDLQGQLQDTIRHLYEEYRRRVFVIIDNIDLCDLDLQRTAVDHASFLSSWRGVFPIVSIRPSTYHRLHLHLRKPILYSVNRAPLAKVLERRLEHVWRTDGGNENVRRVLKHLKNVRLEIPWGPLITAEAKPLQQLHKLLMGRLTSNTRFLSFIHDVYNSHTRTVLTVIAQMFRSFYFSEEMKTAVMTESAPHHTLVTAFLRGPYSHYRGWTHRYWVRDLSLLELPNVPSDFMLASVRLLQLLSRADQRSGGQPVSAMVQTLGRFGYPEGVIRSSLVYLARMEIVLDSFRQKPWTTAEAPLQDDDCFVLAPCGLVVLSLLCSEYAFRYCDAMADVTRRPRVDGQPWRSDKSFGSMVWNALGIVELVHNAATEELRRMKMTAETNGWAVDSSRNEFAASFLDAAVPGGRFIVDLTEECCARSEMLSQSRDTSDFGFKTEIRAYKEQVIPVLIQRARRLQQMQVGA